MYYGSPLWPLSGGELDSLCVAWRKALRAIWKIHPMTDFDIISAMAGKSLILSLKSRFVNFFNMCMSCENDVVKTIAFIGISNPMSYAGNNYKLLLNDQNAFGVFRHD